MSMIRADMPFVLLDDMRAEGCGARLYRNPLRTIAADTPAEVRGVLDQLRDATGTGLYAAGFLAYEAGHAFEPRLKDFRAPPPAAWFGLFEMVEAIPPGSLPGLLPDPAGGWAATPVPQIGREEHRAALDTIKRAIAAGDIYQANLTFPASVAIAGDPLAIYARLRSRAAAPWGGIVWTGARWLLSFSPELFFRLGGRTITTKPMKGTAPPDTDPAALRGDPKQRAENLMIVDLLRNDLARVAVPGSVKVPALFTVEHYPTVQQLTSTVTATLAPGHDAIDLVAAAFPCGSVTGAPKLRAMEIIAAVEKTTRGAYTGSIGRFDPDGSAAFNVAIRTLDLAAGASIATLGLGSGIVADSDADAEWEECLAKGAFVNEPPSFDLLETMRHDPQVGLVELERHLARLKESATCFGFPFDRHGLRNELHAATFRERGAARVRLRISAKGAVAIEVGPLPPEPPLPVDVALCTLPVPAADLRLRHKTSDRGFYDDARRSAAGAFEVLFVDPEGFLTEGSFTSLFVERDGVLLTPPLSRGLLPGVLRATLLDSGRAREADLRAADLRDGFFVGNMLRGLLPARMVAAGEIAGL